MFANIVFAPPRINMMADDCGKALNSLNIPHKLLEPIMEGGDNDWQSDPWVGSAAKRSSERSLLDCIVLAEFDIDTGSTVRHMVNEKNS